MTEHFKSVGDIAQSIVNGMSGERVWDGKPIAEPGVYSAVDIDRYHRDTSLFADDGFSISSTGIRQILDRPISYWFTSPFNPDAQESEVKKELDFGKAAHMLLLGERGFAERYALRPRDYENDKGEWKPGPWSVSNGHLLRVTTTTHLPLVICGIHRLGKNGGPAIGDPHANARLIAAAPDLLKALKGLLVLFEEIDGGANDHADEFIAARRAISKAEGKL